MANQIILIAQIIISILLIGAIIIQRGERGLNTAGRGFQEFYRSKRGVEKIIFLTTIILGLIFLIISIISVVVG